MWHLTPEQRYWRLVGERLPNECWEVDTKPAGGNGRYRTFRVDGKAVYLHRWAYETFVGPIPEGMTVDHMCCRPACVNPQHLRALAPADNTRAYWHGQREMCRNGVHEMTPDNVHWVTRRGSRTRACRSCWVERKGRESRARLLSKARPTS